MQDLLTLRYMDLLCVGEQLPGRFGVKALLAGVDSLDLFKTLSPEKLPGTGARRSRVAKVTPVDIHGWSPCGCCSIHEGDLDTTSLKAVGRRAVEPFRKAAGRSGLWGMRPE